MTAAQLILKHCPDANLEGVSEQDLVTIASVYARQFMPRFSFTPVYRAR
jgi:hypothetical protein